MPDIRSIHCAESRRGWLSRVGRIGIASLIGTAVTVAIDPLGHEARAGHIVLKSGLRIEGRPSHVQTISPDIVVETGGVNENYPIVMVDSNMVRYFVRDRFVADINKDATLGTIDVFKLKNRAGGDRSSQVPEFLGPPLEMSLFDADGRRTIKYQEKRGPVTYQQVITEIGPQHVKVSTVKLGLDFSLPTTSIPPARLDEMIRKVTDQQKPADRMTIARFYVQAGRYVEALRELENITKEFPEHAEKTAEFAIEARQQLAEQLLSELASRRSRNQHKLAYTVAKQFPTEQLNAGALRRLREFLAEYDDARDETERAIAMLGELQGMIRSEAQREALEALRSEVAEQLGYETLPRLKPFLRQASDDTRSPDEKLALAYSGWLMGEGAAIDSLTKVLSLARARQLMLNYLRETDSQQRKLLAADITKVEGIGPQSVLSLIPHLPLPLDTPEATVGKPFAVTVSQPHSGVEDETVPVSYQVMLPPEYSPTHRYPLVVALRPLRRPAEWSLRWWGGNADEPLQAQRHGYIVIAPEYFAKDATAYDYGSMSHFAVLQAIRDARKKFNIDSNRIYLSGHSEGGDAAFDIGLSHPDEFAGVIPITGMVGEIPAMLKHNGHYTGMFVINGQLDRAISASNGKKTNRNLGTINAMMMPGQQDVLYAEYAGRGNESFYGEIHRLFAWMETRTRPAPPHKFEIFSMRPNDNRFFWMKAHTLPPAPVKGGRVTLTASSSKPAIPTVQTKTTHFKVEMAEESEKETLITLYAPGTGTDFTLWLTPEIVRFDKKVRVQFSGRPKFNDFVAPQIETMLEDLRVRGDRQRVYQCRVEIN